MARKANIAREEIHQACWDLLEQNHFPNIPRVADYFEKKDGRRASNTTLMNAISDWEESYKEYQQHQLKELNDALQPAINHFSRQVTQTLGTLLDEKQLDLEQQQALKENATHQGYLSLSGVLCEAQAELEASKEENAQHISIIATLNQELEHSQQQLADTVSHLNVTDAQLKQAQKEREELQLNLSQKEVDLAKLDNQVIGLSQKNEQLKAKLAEFEKQQNTNQSSQLESLHKQMEELNKTVLGIQNKDRDKR